MQTLNNNKLPKRDEIDAKYKWHLEDMYADLECWETDYKRIKGLISEMVAFKGTLVKSPHNLLNCLKLQDSLLSKNDMLFCYARMKRDEDNANPSSQSLTDRAMAISTEVYASISFIVPELIKFEDDKLQKFITQLPELSLYSFYFEEILRQKKHILSESEEELLALGGEVAHASADIFTMFNNADIKFAPIINENGEEIEVTKGRYVQLLESYDRRVRKDAFNSLYTSYSNHRNSLAAMLLSNIKKNKYYSSVRKYDSSINAALDSDNVKPDVYDNLIETVNASLPLLHRYLELRKKSLNLDELHMYDLYVPIVTQPKKSVLYSDALDMIKEGLKPLGVEYGGYLKTGLESGWIDVFENVGKTSGAYSWGCYASHPYVLLNYQGTINDVFTLAHEMGHALHSFYTNKTQPYAYSEYKIFVAEVASTVNEALLIRHLLSKTTDKSERAYLLNHHLEEFRGTLFRQVMFAEFEKITHNKIESGEALTTEDLCNIYYDLNVKYFGSAVNVDREIEMEWSRIPHFYNSFYVYKYATGFSAAIALSTQILKEGEPAVKRYLEFLSGGGSNYPLELLKIAGVDLTTPAPVEEALKLFEVALLELESLL